MMMMLLFNVYTRLSLYFSLQVLLLEEGESKDQKESGIRDEVVSESVV